MVDVFDEVDEQLRSQRFEGVLRRAWPFAAAAAGVILIAALGIWGWTKHEAAEQAKASSAYQTAVDALLKGDFVTARKDFAALAASAPPAYRALSLMQEAQISLDHKTADDAVRLLDQAAKAAPDRLLGDAARLKAAFILMDDRPQAEVEARLTPLAEPKAPYRPLALEALAMAKLQAGRLDEAKSAFQVLMLTPDVSQTAQARARAALALIASGGARGVPAAIRAARAVPADKAALFSRLAAAAAAPAAGAPQ